MVREKTNTILFTSSRYWTINWSLFCVTNIARLYFSRRFVRKIKVFNRQPTSEHNKLLCCEGTAAGFPEDGVNKNHTRRKRGKYVSEEMQCAARQSVNKSQFISSCQLVSTQNHRTNDFVRLRCLEISYIDLRFSNTFNYRSVFIRTVIIMYCNC